MSEIGYSKDEVRLYFIMIKIGQEVKVKSLDIMGKVEYIDWPNLYNDYMYPIQLELRGKYYNGVGDNVYMYRCALRDLVLEM